MTYQQLKVVTYPTTIVVAAALKAAELSNGEIVKHDQTGYTRQNFDGSETVIPTVKSTRQVMIELLQDPSGLDTSAAEEAINFVHGAATMAVFCGKPISDFTKKMIAKVQDETVTSSDIGFMVYFVPVHNNFKKAAEKREQTLSFSTSEFFGTVGEKVEIDLTVLESHWVDKFGLYSVFGHTADGNLVSFFTNKETCKESGKYTGKVKKHEQTQWHENAMVTALNYVKRAK